MRKLTMPLLGISMLFALQSWAQSPVTGQVTDANGLSVPGATIKIKNGRGGTTAGSDGAFKLTVPANALLVVSAVGYETKEVPMTGQGSVIIQLAIDTKAIGEVVVTGTGVATSKKKLAISVESVTADKLPPGNTASVDQALVGKIAGAQISSNGGQPGSKVNIVLRGINTLQGGTNPMILIDGLQLGATDLNSIDLNSIERVEVIQGAAAATIYGAQGANGVIQLFSKKGKAGQINVDFASSITNNTYLNIGKVGKAQYHAFETNASNQVIDGNGDPITFDPITGTYSANLIWDALNPENQTNKKYDQNLQYHDHFKSFFVPANTFNNSVSVSGGKDKLDFSLSASNNHQESNFKNSGYLDRSNFTSNIGFEIAKGLKFRSTTQLIYTRNTVTGDQGLVYPVFNSRPYADYDAKGPDGHYYDYLGNALGVNGSNPNYANEYRASVDNKIDVVQGLNLTYRFPRFIELDAKYGLNFRTDDGKVTIQNQSENLNSIATDHWVSAYNPDRTGEIDKYTNSTVFQNFLASVTGRVDFQKDLHMKLPLLSTTQVAFDYRNNKYKEYDSYSLGLPLYTPFTADQGTSFKTIYDHSEPFITYGYLVTERLDYADLAGISGGFRSDYSSAFGRGSKPFLFPRGDAYIRLSSLDFWHNGSLGNVFSEFKLRAAFGQAGIQPGAFQRYVTLSTRTLGSSNAFYVGANQPNPDLGVEVSQELEVGTDMSFNVFKGNFLKNINVSVTYWDRKTKNAIWPADAAPSAGIGTIVDNTFSLASHGIQASLNASIISTKNFNWNFTTNFGKQTSKITDVKGGAEVVLISNAGSTNYVLKPGLKIGQLFGYLGLHDVNQLSADGTPYIDKADQANYTVASNGWVVDKATKQPYFTPNQYSFGDPNPKFNISFINDFTLKGMLSFNFQIDWLSGAHLYNQTKEWMYRDGIHKDFATPITIGDETGAWTAFYRGVYAQVARNGTKNYFYENSSFVRLRNIAIAFDFAKIIHIRAIKKLQLVLSGRNLITLTNYTGMDPEISSGATNSAWDRGTDHSTVPNYRSFQAGINVGF